MSAKTLGRTGWQGAFVFGREEHIAATEVAIRGVIVCAGVFLPAMFTFPRDVQEDPSEMLDPYQADRRRQHTCVCCVSARKD